MTTNPKKPEQNAQVIVTNVRKPEQVPEGFTRIYVGRDTSYRRAYGEDYSALGNPFRLPLYERAEAISEYRRWLPVIVTRDLLRGEALNVLRDRFESGENLALMCFCHPQACHADVIKELLERQP